MGLAWVQFGRIGEDERSRVAHLLALFMSQDLGRKDVP